MSRYVQARGPRQRFQLACGDAPSDAFLFGVPGCSDQPREPSRVANRSSSHRRWLLHTQARSRGALLSDLSLAGNRARESLAGGGCIFWEKRILPRPWRPWSSLAGRVVGQSGGELPQHLIQVPKLPLKRMVRGNKPLGGGHFPEVPFARLVFHLIFARGVSACSMVSASPCSQITAGCRASASSPYSFHLRKCT